jgi:MoxR-like ATPase
MKSNSVRLDSNELKDFLNHMIENNRVIQADGKNPVAVEILGESGLGKTSSVIQLADERKLNFVKLNLAQIEELGDLVGFPIRQFKMLKEAESGLKVHQWIDEHAVEEFSRQGYKFTGQKRMSYCPPEWIADKTGGGILLLDDWNRSDQRFIQAVMELK